MRAEATHRRARRTPAPTRSSSASSRASGSPTTSTAARSQALVGRRRGAAQARKLAVAHAGGKRWRAGGPRQARRASTPSARGVAAARSSAAPRELGTRDAVLGAPAPRRRRRRRRRSSRARCSRAYEFAPTRASRRRGRRGSSRLRVSAHHDVSARGGRAPSSPPRPPTRARDLQNAPANDMTPTRLAERARELAAEQTTAERRGDGPRRRSTRAGMGAFAAVAQGCDEEPQLITLRYTPAEASGPVLGLVGKAVTFDSGGISIKPASEDERDEVRHVRRRGRARGDRPRSPGSGCRSRSSR